MWCLSDFQTQSQIFLSPNINWIIQYGNGERAESDISSVPFFWSCQDGKKCRKEDLCYSCVIVVKTSVLRTPLRYQLTSTTTISLLLFFSVNLLLVLTQEMSHHGKNMGIFSSLCHTDRQRLLNLGVMWLSTKIHLHEWDPSVGWFHLKHCRFYNFNWSYWWFPTSDEN